MVGFIVFFGNVIFIWNYKGNVLILKVKFDFDDRFRVNFICNVVLIFFFLYINRYVD